VTEVILLQPRVQKSWYESLIPSPLLSLNRGCSDFYFILVRTSFSGANFPPSMLHVCTGVRLDRRLVDCCCFLLDL
jgi:hypothetical protein